MKRFHLFFAFVLLFSFFAMHSTVFAQEEPVMYFCEKYGTYGEQGVSDRFTTGYLTVMVRSNRALGLYDVSIQLDKYNFRTGEFNYYKKFDYSLDPESNYVFFAKNDDSDMEFEDPGFYRVFLLDDRDRTVASAIIEIIRDRE
ncbi:MAG: hypothetical protein IH852_15890 [Bacteroidetes bacterium]|nr:hypothetical protein [Bacteroidota bacterium]